MEQKLSWGFPPPFSSDFRKEKFISAFISKLDAIYCLSKAHFSLACRIHGPWQAMRICPPPLASGANMWKLAWGYGVQPMEEEAEGQRRESIPNRWGVGSRRGEEEVEKKNLREKTESSVFTSRHLGAVSWLEELWDIRERKPSYITRLLKQGERVWETGRQKQRTRQGPGKKHCHLKWQGQHYQSKNKHGTHTHTELPMPYWGRWVTNKQESLVSQNTTNTQMWTQVRGYHIHHACIILAQGLV